MFLAERGEFQGGVLNGSLPFIPTYYVRQPFDAGQAMSELVQMAQASRDTYDGLDTN